MQEKEQQIGRRVEEWKRRLIDLSKRNRLLFFKPAVTSTIGLVEPDVHSLYDSLVSGGKKLRFFLSDPSMDLTDLGDGGDEADSHPRRPLKPNEILTNLPDTRLLRTLYSLRQKSRASVQEQGLVTLFVAFGFLKWFESDSSEVAALSPLILAPVELDHKTARDPYQLSLFEEECVVNPTLIQKLKAEFNIELPELSGIETADLDGFLKDTAEHVKPLKRWAVEEQAYLGLFSFHKLRMFRDLEEHADAAEQHPIVAALAGDKSRLEPPPADLPRGTELDAQVSPKDTFQILDADSSQQEAIQAAKRGVSFVLQGPPGTGKSQTIANIIAERLAQGKTVLFVSEKMAALEVVHRRLTHAGLAEFCLQAHSHKANKKEVIQELGRTLNAPPSKRSSVPVDFAGLEATRQSLNTYVRALHIAQEPLGYSAYHVNGLRAGLDAAPDLEYEFPHPLRVDPGQLASITERLNEVALYHDIIISYEIHPWRGVQLDEYRLQTQTDIRIHFGQLANCLDRTRDRGGEVARLCGLPAPECLRDIKRTIGLGTLVADTPRPPGRWFELDSLTPLVEAAQGHQRIAEGYHQRRHKLLGGYEEGIFDLPLPALVNRFTDHVRVLTEMLVPGSTEDILVSDGQTFNGMLINAVATLRRLISQAQALASLLGLLPPTTITDAWNLRSIAVLALRDPKPNADWFVRSNLVECEATADEAKTHYSLYHATSVQLEERYEREVLTLDHHALLDRFTRHYGSFFRVFKPAYYHDRRALVAHQKTRAKLPYDQAINDLRVIGKVKAGREWIEARQEIHGTAFGRHFHGLDTDWSEISDALLCCRQIVDRFSEGGVPRTLIQVLVASGPSLQPVSALRDAVDSTLSQLEQALSSVRQTLTLHPLPFTHYGWRDADMEALAGWLEGLRTSLQGTLEDYETVVSVRRTQVSSGRPELAELRRDLVEAQHLNEQLAAAESRAAELKCEYGHLFDGMETPWEKILGALVWTGQVLSLFAGEPLPGSFVAVASGESPGAESLPPLLPGLRDLWRETEDEVGYLLSLFPGGALSEAGAPIGDIPLNALRDWLQFRISRLSDLERWLHFKRLAETLEREGLGSFLHTVLRAQPPAASILAAFQKRFWSLWLDAVHREEPGLLAFDGMRHDQVIERFQGLDREQIRSARLRAYELLVKKRPDPDRPFGEYGYSMKVDKIGRVRHRTTFVDERSILLREVNKKKRHKPLRQLFREIPNCLLALKPCLLMSPLSAAQLLELDGIRFDVVIFDEASQICTEDAIGAILRGKQAIVVGDNKQLPPTRFFSAGSTEEYETEEEEEEALSEAYESILDECLSIGLPSTSLLWHYRSKCEALIAFSNQHFYNNRLVTFPGASTPSADGAGHRCVEFVHVPDGVYTSGKVQGAGANRVEAMKVAQLVFQHFATRPGDSLGVIAFSQAQQVAIDQEVFRFRKLQPSFDGFFNEDAEEAFFIKNLESVQGDERDTILFSVGYGRDNSNKLSMNFGPLNRAGGERRLNVAVTRARKHVKLISSVLPQDIDLTRTRMKGPESLKNYMQFALQGPSALAQAVHTTADAEFESLFEAEVCHCLEGRGLTIHRQVGCSGYRIDLAVVDADHPGRYLLGVECDGATYHSFKIARDRDRLRQEVLEGLGWQMVRVWSTDWVKDPARCVERVLQALEGAKQAAPAIMSEAQHFAMSELTPHPEPAGHRHAPLPEAPPAPDEPSPRADTVADEWVNVTFSDRPSVYRCCEIRSFGPPSQFYSMAQTDMGMDRLSKLVERVVSAEGPVHRMAVLRRILSGWGMNEADARAFPFLNKALDLSAERGATRPQGDFLWARGTREVEVRVPAEEELPRNVEEVAVEEIGAAAYCCIRTSSGRYTDSKDDLINQTADLMGYSTVEGSIGERIGIGISYLEHRGLVQIVGTRVTLSAHS